VSTTQEHPVAHAHRDDIGTRMGMWLFLFTELLLFGGLFFLYSVYRFTHQQDFHIAAKELNTLIGTFNTAILLTSSLTMALAIAAIQKRNVKLSVFFQILTILLGAGFMINKYF
jgi:cytochrome c oxidase subunit 3